MWHPFYENVCNAREFLLEIIKTAINHPSLNPTPPLAKIIESDICPASTLTYLFIYLIIYFDYF